MCAGTGSTPHSLHPTHRGRQQPPIPQPLRANFLLCACASLLRARSSPSAGANIKDKAVCPAFFDVYFGKSPVSPAAKDGVAAGFARRGFYQ